MGSWVDGQWTILGIGGMIQVGFSQFSQLIWSSVNPYLMRCTSPKRNYVCFQKFGKLGPLKIGPESADHLFVSCNQISPVWYAILRWLGVQWVSPRGNLGLFEVFLEGTFSAECLIDRVKLLSWKWFLGTI
ncbi:hypothetical protein A2U01_0025287 [Trifolium medium]|uniref:Uncharacterized protein n=1 Tax=Trifolium medium TaxID=97028 RepID=A0A392NXQ7_9FABA|nr:hypothetical protein [Trifolium medium]